MLSARLVFIALLSAATLASAQDTRTVTEPKVPEACVTLKAERYGDKEKLPVEYEKTTDTARIQKAIDGCKPGMAVELASGVADASGAHASKPNAFLTGALDMREGVTLLVDNGITLYGSRDPKDYDPDPTATTSKLLCGTMVEESTSFDPASKNAPLPGRPCKPLISIVNVKNVGIMGTGTIDGRGFATIMGHDYSWWQMARKAEPKQQKYFSTRLIVASHADGLTMYQITLHNSPNFHVSVNNTDGFTVWNVHLQTPTVKGVDARNTDGIDPGSSKNITITKSWIDNGDDNVAIKTGTTYMSVLDNHFYNGHGMSMGSETYTGDSNILVDGLTEDHTTSGIRIKSNAARGGLVHDVIYRNICMRDVGVPIAISPFYNNQTIEGFVDPGIKGDKIPDYKRITLQNILSTTPGEVLIAGKDADHMTEVTLDGVRITGITPAQVHSQYTKATVVGGTVNFELKGEGVETKTQRSMSSGMKSCDGPTFKPFQ